MRKPRESVVKRTQDEEDDEEEDYDEEEEEEEEEEEATSEEEEVVVKEKPQRSSGARSSTISQVEHDTATTSAAANRKRKVIAGNIKTPAAKRKATVATVIGTGKMQQVKGKMLYDEVTSGRTPLKVEVYSLNIQIPSYNDVCVCVFFLRVWLATGSNATSRMLNPECWSWCSSLCCVAVAMLISPWICTVGKPLMSSGRSLRILQRKVGITLSS